jgi:diaminopimelate decarboxylase
MPAPTLPASADTLLAIADAHGTPTYVYSERIVERQARKLGALFGDLDIAFLYAMKANPAPPILETLGRMGFGVDAVSPGEMLWALRLGIPADRILFSANMMTDAEMESAQAHGVMLNIGELTRLERYGRAYPGSDVCVRLNPKHGAGHHAHVVTAGDRTKFGVPIEQIDDVIEIARAHRLRIVGVHQHIGSGILSAQQFADAIAVTLDSAPRFEHARWVNLGGGLGIPYQPGDAELDEAAFHQQVVEPLRAYQRAYPHLSFRLEPGRFLTAQAGVLLARVNTVKQGSRRTFAGTDTGMGQLVRPTVYDAYHHIANLSNPDAAPRPYDVTGNICETGDVLARERALPEVREGDVLAVLDAGAYGMSMASTYNLRPLPAEVWLGEGDTPRLLRARESDQAFVERTLGGYLAVTA